MMYQQAIVFILISFFTSALAQEFCSFSFNCNCEQNQDSSYSVYCVYFGLFPTFNEFNGTIKLVEVTGTFTSIPANAFSNLLNFPSPTVTFWRNGDDFAPLTIDDNAFLLPSSQNSYESITFKSYKNLSIPTTALSKISLKSLKFIQGSFDTIPDNSFKGVQVTSINFLDCAVETISDNAFASLNPSGATNVVIDFTANRLSEIPKAINTINGLNVLSLAVNQITHINDDAFCSSLNCPTLQTIGLQSNQISNISSKAFANIPNLIHLDLADNQLSTLPAQTFQLQVDLFSLGLDHNMLTSIPLNVLQPIGKSLYHLKLNSNQITNIGTNSFVGLTNLNTLTLDNNPVTQIDNGAFNFMPWSVLNLTTLPNLQSIDVLATYGMSNVRTFQLYNCAMLQNITMIDKDKVPSTLKKVGISYSGLRSVDPNFDDWLKASTDNLLDISYNKNFFCNTTDIAWIAPYVLCSQSYSQINVQETYCGLTPLSLFDYLDLAFRQVRCP